MRQIPAASVATGLLGSDNQAIDVLLHAPDLLETYRAAFRHVPELQQLILFDRTERYLGLLGEAIDTVLVRANPATTRLPLPQGLAGLGHLPGLLRYRHGQVGDALPSGLIHDLADLNEQRVSLFVGINLLRQRGVDPWLISCLHQIRAFGNWMVHPQGPGRRRQVEIADVLAVLAALQRVLADYPWEQDG